MNSAEAQGWIVPCSVTANGTLMVSSKATIVGMIIPDVAAEPRIRCGYDIGGAEAFLPVVSFQWG